MFVSSESKNERQPTQWLHFFSSPPSLLHHALGCNSCFSILCYTHHRHLAPYTHLFSQKLQEQTDTHTHTHVSSVPDIDRYVVSSSLRPASLDLRRREKLLFSLFSLALQHVIPSHLLRLSPDPDRRLLEARQKVSVKGAAAAAVLCCWATSTNRHLQQQQQQQRQMRVRMQAHDLGG
ncbi:hypothetical protein CGCSCA1_v011998 [Colletotrichum siamense]|nr:hypothetical protein CGCSCA1_v011998 [Colletotrichum siamense]